MCSSWSLWHESDLIFQLRLEMCLAPRRAPVLEGRREPASQGESERVRHARLMAGILMYIE